MVVASDMDLENVFNLKKLRLHSLPLSLDLLNNTLYSPWSEIWYPIKPRTQLFYFYHTLYHNYNHKSRKYNHKGWV